MGLLDSIFGKKNKGSTTTAHLWRGGEYGDINHLRFTAIYRIFLT